MRILFLAANPLQTGRLDLENELRSLEEELESVEHRRRIVLEAHHAVRADDLVKHVRSFEPHVIHFSGHSTTGGIVLRTETGGYVEVGGEVLQRVLEGRGVELVVLNACHTEGQASLILRAVRAVVGTTQALDDTDARRFTVAFYRGLGNGLPVREAFRDGRDVVTLEGGADVFRCGGDLDLVFFGES